MDGEFFAEMSVLISSDYKKWFREWSLCVHLCSTALLFDHSMVTSRDFSKSVTTIFINFSKM